MMNFDDFVAEMQQDLRDTREKQKKAAAKIKTPYGQANYKMLKPYLDRIKRENGTYLAWKEDGMKSIAIEVPKESGFALMQDPVLMFTSHRGFDTIYAPMVTFYVDHAGKKVVPMFVQHDDLMLAWPVFDENYEKVNNAALMLADNQLNNCLRFMSDWGVRPDDMKIG